MKLAAVVPALFVLISLCGSPVPAPPGSVSGVAFYDANRNGIHDMCDRPLALATIVATAADGKTETSTSGPDGTFHIDKVDRGQALVTLAAPDGELWHTTTTTADGTPGASVEVKDLRDSGGVEIGATSSSPMSATQISVSGVIFDDANGNGQIDKDECGIPQAWAYINGSENKSMGGTMYSDKSGDGTYFVYGLDAAGNVLPNLPDAGWVATTGGPGGNPCHHGLVPSSWHGTTVYEANIGFKRDATASSFTGMLFDDQNSNGVRDSGEAGVPGVELLLEPDGAHGANCGSSGTSNTTADSAGKFEFKSVQSGSYQVAIVQNSSRHDNQIIALNYPQHTYTVAPTGLAADIPARIQPAAYATVQFFADANGNGRWDADESQVFSYIYACLSTSSSMPDFSGGPGKLTPSPGRCASNGGGVAQIGPVPEGDYSLFVWDQSGPPATLVLTGLHLSAASSSVSVDVPVGTEPTLPTPQLVPGIAPAQTMAVCYSDSGWVQRPFDDGYDPTQPFYASWGVNEMAARAIYSAGIYAATPTNSPDTYVWSAIAGLPWREPPGCDPSQTQGWAPTYDLVGLEPISVTVPDQDTTQITLRPTGHGLYGIMLSPLYLPLPRYAQVPTKNVIFVDESGAPIAECDALGACRDVAHD